MKRIIGIVRRFWLQVDSSKGPDACWPWLGARFRHSGYGKASWRNRTQNAHRVALIFASGGNRLAMEADHLCRNKSCCNPAHLEWVTPQINKQRRSAVRTHCRQGHVLDGMVQSNKGTYRRCLTCARAASAEQRLKPGYRKQKRVWDASFRQRRRQEAG